MTNNVSNMEHRQYDGCLSANQQVDVRSVEGTFERNDWKAILGRAEAMWKVPRIRKYWSGGTLWYCISSH